MKKQYFILLVLFIMACGETDTREQEQLKDLMPTDIVNNPVTANGIDSIKLDELPVLSFTDTVYNFGNIKAGEVVSHDFEFTNTGKTPLIISNTSVACGCTVPDYPHEPIPPGKSAVLTVKFNSEGKSGHQDKSVTVTANTFRGTHMLYIKGDVK